MSINRRFAVVTCVGKIDIPEMQGKPVTFSVGTAFYPSGADDCFAALYQRADEGTCESKKRRGNNLSFRL